MKRGGGAELGRVNLSIKHLNINNVYLMTENAGNQVQIIEFDWKLGWNIILR